MPQTNESPGENTGAPNKLVERTGLNLTRGSAVHTRPRWCSVAGCCWRGTCPTHDVAEHQLDHLARLVTERPYGPGWTAA